MKLTSEEKLVLINALTRESNRVVKDLDTKKQVYYDNHKININVDAWNDYLNDIKTIQIKLLDSE